MRRDYDYSVLGRTNLKKMAQFSRNKQIVCGNNNNNNLPPLACIPICSYEKVCYLSIDSWHTEERW